MSDNKKSKLVGNVAEPMIAWLKGSTVELSTGKGDRKKTLKFKSVRKARHFYDCMTQI